jgi:hypothetical protein
MTDSAEVTTQVGGSLEDALGAVLDLVERRQLRRVHSVDIRERAQTMDGKSVMWEITVEGELP